MIASAVIALAGCRFVDDGLPGVGSATDGGISMVPAPARPDGGGGSDLRVPSTPPPGDVAIVIPDASVAEAAPVPVTPPPAMPPASSPDTAAPAVDVAPSPTDMANAPDTAPMPPISADPCGPPAGTQLTATVRVRGSGSGSGSGSGGFGAIAGSGSAEDFTFVAGGQMLMLESGNLQEIDSTGRAEMVTRNLVFRGGRLRGLADGDLLVLDAFRNQLSRVDPTLRRPDRFPMFVRGPLQMAPFGGTSPGLFFVTNEQGQIFRANADNGDLSMLVDLGTVNFGGLAVDATKRKLYFGVVGNGGSVHALDIGNNGQLSGLTMVADNTPSPGALVVDSCGGLYIGSGSGGTIRRRSPTGVVSAVARLDARDVTTLEFGTGKQGWSDQSIFALEGATGAVYEIRVRP